MVLDKNILILYVQVQTMNYMDFIIQNFMHIFFYRG